MYTTLASEDYQVTARTVTFMDGITEQNISVFINTDEIPENTETFRARLTNVSPPNVAFIMVPEAIINIIDQNGIASFIQA